MIIKKVKIINYKNFDEELIITFNDNINFIIGENNIGKSNLIKLFHEIFNSYSYEMFKENDFNNKEKEICINLTLKLDIKEELGIFEDNFNFKEDFSEINIEIKQKYEEDVEIKCLDSHSELKLNDLNKFNLFYLDSAKNKNTHLDFDKKIDIGSTLNLLLEHNLKKIKTDVNSDLEKIKDFENVNNLLQKLNDSFSKLHIPSNHNIKIDFNNLENIVTQIFMLKEKTGIDFKKSGEGLKSLLYLELAILYKLFSLKKKSDKQSKLPTRFDSILIIDEPEVHLHTYKQRSFIKYLLKNFKFNKDTENNRFKLLINEIFNIEQFERQIFIVTHSPNIIINDFKSIIRFYRENDKVKTISGEDIQIENESEINHYLKHEIYIKEAFFSKGVILCEGDTEIGLFRAFFEKKKLDLDLLEASVISCNGCESMPILKEIFDKFKINVIGFRDKDKLDNKEIKILESNNIYFTEHEDSEEDYIQSINEVYFKKKIFDENIFNHLHPLISRGILQDLDLKKISKTLKDNKNINFAYKAGNCLDIVPKNFDFIIELIRKKINENE